MKQIIVDANDFEMRVALLEDDVLTEFFIEREERARMVGSIYKGKVANVLPGMESAFVNIGLPKNAFLYVKDLREFEEKYLDGIENSKKPIEDILNVGDEVVVQVLKEPTGNKGARVTTHYTIPGKYLVLMPNNDHIAISKKINDEEERTRLQKILEDIKPSGVGVIIRTAAREKDESVFVKEIEYLIKQWKEIERKLVKSKVGDVVFRDNNLIRRVIRDVFSSDVDYLVINSEDEYYELIDYMSAFFESEFKVKIKLYQEVQPIFDYYKVNEKVERALNKKVWLDCGGYLVIEKTEALVSIDVNTGKNTGSTDLETTVFETNLEAAKEIPNQLRLRNLSGIIIIDFIDMTLEEDQKEVTKVLQENLEKDRIRNEIVHFTKLGLVEMTRKRVGKQLSTYFMEECDKCSGTGFVKSVETVIQNILDEIKFVATDEDLNTIKLTASEEICKKIKSIYIDFIESYLTSKSKKGKLKKINIFEGFAFEREKFEIVLEK
jgi:ribonuclease G